MGRQRLSYSIGGENRKLPAGIVWDQKMIPCIFLLFIWREVWICSILDLANGFANGWQQKKRLTGGLYCFYFYHHAQNVVKIYEEIKALPEVK